MQPSRISELANISDTPGQLTRVLLTGDQRPRSGASSQQHIVRPLIWNRIGRRSTHTGGGAGSFCRWNMTHDLPLLVRKTVIFEVRRGLCERCPEQTKG